MSAVSKLKSRRASTRGRITKQLNAALDKLKIDDVSQVNPDDLDIKLHLIQAIIHEHQDIQESILEQMAVDGSTEEEVQKEVDANLAKEAEFDEPLERISVAIKMGSLRLQYPELMRRADTWLCHGVPSSMEFSSVGNQLVKELQNFIRGISPFTTHPDLGPLSEKATGTVEQVLIQLYKKADTSASTPAPEAASSVRRPAPYTIKAPTFSGKLTDFPLFLERFSEVIKNHWDQYSDGDRCCILAEAMTDPAAKELVETYSSSGYDCALKQLKERYGRASSIYPKYVEQLVTRSKYEYSQDSMHSIIRRVEHTIDSMAKVKGNTLGQVAVALVVRDFNEELAKEWAKHLGPEDKLPDVPEFIAFIKPLSHNLPSKPKPAPPVCSGSSHKRQQEMASAAPE